MSIIYADLNIFQIVIRPLVAGLRYILPQREFSQYAAVFPYLQYKAAVCLARYAYISLSVHVRNERV